jgi:hypothetical protein
MLLAMFGGPDFQLQSCLDIPLLADLTENCLDRGFAHLEQFRDFLVRVPFSNRRNYLQFTPSVSSVWFMNAALAGITRSERESGG